MIKPYITIADTITARIRSGELRTGERLPPQRRFAYENEIANSTAGRVYAELSKRGLITGEVGRGSYVCAWPPESDELSLLEIRKDVAIDMEISFPILPSQSKMMAPALLGILQPNALSKAIRPVATMNDDTLLPHRTVVSNFLGHRDWRPNPSCIVFPGSGRQAIGAAIAALVPVGGRIGVEDIIYPVVKGLVENLGRKLVPISMDNEGMIPDALLAIHQRKMLDAVYVQPTLQNPTGRTMSVARRIVFAKIAIDQDIAIIEDQVYRFLQKKCPPFIAEFAPEQVVLVDSLSKRVAPGLSLGFIASPERYLSKLVIAMKQFGWVSGGFAIEAATRWISDGTIAKLDILKRQDIAQRQSIAQKVLQEHVVNCSKQACQLWLDLPTHWQCDHFVRAAKQLGIAVASGSAFGVGCAPNTVRISVTAKSYDELEYALTQIRDLLEVGS